MDLNKTLSSLQDKSKKIKEELKNFLISYEDLFREVNGIYLHEKMASSSNEGLDDFYHLLQTIRRNRDVAGSLLRGFYGIRPMDKFKFVEEDVPEEKPKKKPKQPPGDQTTPVPGLDDLMTEKVEEPAHA
jgi:hypothetical protein